MPYRFLDNMAVSGVAIEAREDTLVRLAETTCDGVMNIVLEDIADIAEKWVADFSLANVELDTLFFDLIREQISYLETGRLLARVRQVKLLSWPNAYHLTGKFYGEPLDINRHELLVNLKVKYLVQCKLVQKDAEWYARLAFDI